MGLLSIFPLVKASPLTLIFAQWGFILPPPINHFQVASFPRKSCRFTQMKINECLSDEHVYIAVVCNLPSVSITSICIVRSRWIAFINARVVTAWRYILPPSKAGSREGRDLAIEFVDLMIWILVFKCSFIMILGMNCNCHIIIRIWWIYWERLIRIMKTNISTIQPNIKNNCMYGK